MSNLFLDLALAKMSRHVHSPDCRLSRIRELVPVEFALDWCTCMGGSL